MGNLRVPAGVAVVCVVLKSCRNVTVKSVKCSVATSREVLGRCFSLLHMCMFLVLLNWSIQGLIMGIV